MKERPEWGCPHNAQGGSQTAPGSHAGIWRDSHAQYPCPSHANPHTCPGCLLFFAHKSLRLSRLPTLHTQILTPVQDPGCSQENPYACPGSQQVKKRLMWGKAPNNSKNSLGLSRLPAIQITPYYFTGSQQFQQLLTPVQAPDTSHANPYACTGSRQFKQFLMLVQASNASHNSLHD
ncbi:hypothetical protein O181_059015 [Austropuccinia psidii MF-1]|uniref:Uncharacterized protein n=1 Tax=Austropuccinia psidii MF-1 TaxID=1389203 RepID=A0A9Q3EAR5_9BASI|nr:hypothetical protein [Austropuccinia psidii MF-1]